MKMKELKQGDTGLSVALWNTFLINRKFMKQHSYDYEFFELFGTETEAATKRYQQSNGLADSGFLDKNTYTKALNEGLIDGFALEKAISSGLNRISGKPSISFEVVFSGDGNVVFNIPLGAADVGVGDGRPVDQALDSFRSTFIG
jgi:peptidoglycan hydrolase-like protein with peptidoglycan-binding domain